MVTAYGRGHKIEYVNNKWIYSDNKRSFDDSRPCKRCGKMPTKDGYDACLGHIEGATSACCGHGMETPYVI
jgi:hypothetical protein